MSGWIKIHREISEHWIFQDAEKFKWWIDLIIMASHEEHKTVINGSLAYLQRGQLSVSLSFLSARWSRSKEKVLNFLKLLESDQMITRKSDRKMTVITICNYDSYQDVDMQSPTDNRPITDQSPTDNRPMSDQCPTEYKNGKNGEEYINNSIPGAREESVGWEYMAEAALVERFKAQGTAVQMARITGKTPVEIAKLLDVYSANRQMSNLGHKDFSHFCEAFKQAILKEKIKIPTAPQPQEQSQPPQKKVVSSKDIRQQMREMGWEDS